MERKIYGGKELLLVHEALSKYITANGAKNGESQLPRMGGCVGRQNNERTPRSMKFIISQNFWQKILVTARIQIGRQKKNSPIFLNFTF